MSTPGSLAGLATFEPLNIAYERAYNPNPLKTACIEHALTLLSSTTPSTQTPPAPAQRRRLLDLGCGTGVPVAAMLAAAGHSVVGVDIAPAMVAHAAARVKPNAEAGAEGGKGEVRFVVGDMLTFDPASVSSSLAEGGVDGESEGSGEGIGTGTGAPFDGIFIIFSQLQLQYTDLRRVVYKMARALREDGGLLVLGQMPGDSHVSGTSTSGAAGWDATGTWVEDYPAPFMGKMLPTLMLSRAGQRRWLESMGLEVVWEHIGMFQPRDERCVPEEQQYLIARRRGEVRMPLPAV